MSSFGRLLMLLMVFLVFGCKVGPNYRRPLVPVPTSWIHDLNGDPELVNMEWWRQFDDPVLVDLIEIALRENKDLKIAVWRVQQFLGLYQIARGDLFPLADGESVWGKEKISQRLTPLAPGTKNPDYIHQLLLSGSWEIDLWGKLRRETEARYAELLASEQAKRSVIQTLVAAVAAAYIDLLHLDWQLQISLETAESRRKTLDLFNKRYSAGVISKVDLSQIESEYQDAMARIPEFRNAIGRKENAICVLLGRNPSKIPRGSTLEELKFPAIPCGLPSELLFQRPDILEAEDQLIAANARIGVARAQYFPSISLTGVWGNSSRDLADLFKGDARAWNYFLPVTAPIFTAGRISGDVMATEAVKHQAVAAYEKSIIEAFSEVEDALVDLTQKKEQLEAEKEQVKALKKYADLARLRYDEGYTSYLEVLDSERSLFNVMLEYSETYSNYYISSVSLYKSLGGGWICEAAIYAEDNK